MAVEVRPKIVVTFNTDEHEKSNFIKKMKQYLTHMTGNGGPGEQIDIPFIPDKDEEAPDLETFDEEGPEIREADAPQDAAVTYVRLGDLLTDLQTV